MFLARARRSDLIEAAQQLYDFRLYEDGRSVPPFEATTADVMFWLTRAREVLGAVGRELDGLN
jgi:hypothetical protein